MCSQQEVEHGIENVLFEKGADGKTRFGRELDEHLDRRLGRWLMTGGIGFLIFLAGSVWWAAGQEARISELDRRVDTNDENIRAALSDIKNDIGDLRELIIEAIRDK